MWCLDIQTQGFSTNPDIPGVCVIIRNHPFDHGYRNSSHGMHMIVMDYTSDGFFLNRSLTGVRKNWSIILFNQSDLHSY